MKSLFYQTSLAITLAALTNVNAQQPEAAKPPAQSVNKPADIKPALANDDFDKELMRITKMIHKRIIQKQQNNQQTKQTTFTPYKEAISSENHLELLPIPSGAFTWQGEQANDTLQVTLSPFWMAKKEITWEEYDLFMHPKIVRQKNGYREAHLLTDAKEIDFLARPTPQYHPLSDGMPGEDYPMISMTQHAANKYCQWLSYKTGHFYRLPTEAEWEYACLAGSKTKYSWGNDPAEGNKYAWFGGNDDSTYSKPGLKKPNAWGLFDMHGNVMEWTLDQYVPNRKEYFGKDKLHNPWVKATKPYPHVVKGGHWKHKVTNLVASARYQSHPKWKIQDPQEPKSLWYHTDAQTVGFRIVRPKNIPTVEEMYHYWNNGVEEDGAYSAYDENHRLYKPEE